MSKRNELKIFKKTSIEYLKKMYDNSVSYIFAKNTWKSTSPEYYGEYRILLHTRKSLKRIGRELLIFKAPSINGLQISYYKSMAFIFDNFKLQHQIAGVSDDNYLLRDLSTSEEYANEKELKIFKFPSVDKLETLYYKNIGKL
jgi:hypothetical protein